ncbi:MAG: hypothetical protein BVN29_11850 [Nitrospira sp. ST-bin5]|nr:MAG: hypothetical protein BVN29_11850 [Nitrospira sp. ST-bin5]
MSAATDRSDLDPTYERLLMLWTSGVRDYHTMLSDYLTAHSIFVAVIGLIVSRGLLPLSFTVLIALLCAFGVLMCLQMAIVLGRLSGQNALWEWRLRGIEQSPGWDRQKLIMSLYQLHESRQPIQDPLNEPPVFLPSWAFRQHRQWWAHRAVSFPWFFGLVYGMFFVWAATQLIRLIAGGSP